MKFKNKIIISFCIIIFVPIFLATLVFVQYAAHSDAGDRADLWCRRGRIQLFFQFCPASEPVYKRNLSGSIQGGRQPAGETGGWSILEKINQQLEEKAFCRIIWMPMAMGETGHTWMVRSRHW